MSANQAAGPRSAKSTELAPNGAADVDDDAAWERELSIVIPAYNEAEGIEATLRELREKVPNAEIIVVDDGSTDATAERAMAVGGVRVLVHDFNRGYGGALKTGMTRAAGKYVAWHDADNEHTVANLVEMVRRIHREKLAAVIGRRRNPGRGMVRTWGKVVIGLVARTFGVDVGRDLNCGQRVFRRSVILRYLGLLPDSYSASLTSTMILLQRGYRFSFHDVDVKPRIGESKVRLKHGFYTLALVLRTVMVFAPMRVLLVPGLLVMLSGLTYSVLWAILVKRGVPTAGVLITLAGALTAVLGLVADQVSQLRLALLSRPDDVDVREPARLLDDNVPVPDPDRATVPPLSP